MKLDLWIEDLPDEGEYERVTISLGSLTFAECTDEWGNSDEGKEHLAGCILYVNGPKPHEIKKVAARFDVQEGRKKFVLYFKRDPCPVLFFGGALCPICGEDHEKV